LAPDSLRGDKRGQMMILSAVILLIGFIALSGMVSRVSQLGSQTAIENEQTILDELGPLADTLDNAICRLKSSTISRAPVTATIPVNTATLSASGSPAFVSADIGMTVSGTGLPAGTRIIAVPTASTLTLSNVATTAGSGSYSFTACLLPGTASTFGRSDTSSPTMDIALAGVLEEVQALEATHGLFMDWSIGCVGADVTKGQVTAHLWDGTVWLEVKSSVMFGRAACTTVAG
jgi:hypothetical protein